MADEDSINEYFVEDTLQDQVGLNNDEILGRIKLNDPGITSLGVGWDEEMFIGGEFVQSVNWSVEGKSIGDNTQLKRIAIYGLGDNTRRSIKSFCIGLAGNQSIEEFRLSDSELPLVIADESIMATLYPFFAHNNSLKSIAFDDCVIGDNNTRMLAFSLNKRSNKSTLRKINFWNCVLGGEQVVGELMTALEGCDNLKELSLSDTVFGGKGGFTSLAKFLQKTDCSLEKLDISHNNLDNECSIYWRKCLPKIDH